MKRYLNMHAVLTFALAQFLMGGIYGPEGLNMPNNYNGWANPPSINAFAGIQTAGGTLLLVATGTPRYHTVIKCAASGGDVVAGYFEFKFSSGPTTNYWANAWGGTAVAMNTLQSFTFGSGTNNSITFADGKWYTVNFKDNGYVNTDVIFMETTGEPVTISTVTDNYSGAGNPVDVSITPSATPAAEEKIYVRYTTDGWATSAFVQATGSGTSWSATIPAGSVVGTAQNQYYVMTTTIATPTHADADMQTISLANNGGTNYLLPVELSSFSGKTRNGSVELNWNTATETNNSGFAVERSIRGGTWERIGFVAGNGTSNAPHAYSYTDAAAPKTVASYRLKQIDNDGKFVYSNVVEVATSVAPNGLLLDNNYPNPFNPTTNISFVLGTTGHAALKVFNVIGAEVATLANGTFSAGEVQTVKFDATHFPSGVYYYRLQTVNGVQTHKMVLTK